MREIKVTNNNGSCQLKFSVSGRRYSFNPVPGASYSNKRDLSTVQAIAIRIQNDILAGCFDPSLNRYRTVQAIRLERPKDALALFDRWLSTLDIPAHTLAGHYKYTRKMIEKARARLDDTRWFTDSKLSARTLKDRLSLLKMCWSWAVQEGLIAANPWLKVKLPKQSRNEIQPFSRTEIQAILDGFKAKAPHYVPFASFLLLTGCRLSEAIGLCWQDVDMEQGTITIRRSLSIDRTGNGYRRVMKPTKTGSVRVLPMSEPLRAVLSELPKQHDLVFLTVTGKPIDGGNFREDHWKPILASVGVPYRKIHTARHSVLSHAIAQGTPMTGVAYLAGHKDTRMVMTTYGHMIDRPKLPELI